ncbi:MFS transporter, SP family, sugar:H+ symporter [Fonsecaea erecta]|uniref:MFS transporter, SP family, sugar:H+ symporter n=1 Tax=Fonsecaea erecta TaxID=1367422 RepID=A0A178Z458_9EURO|nr:MFS transporter, SP family, sugar:H+ symporter [Fonsecaea erecta]OAP54331.1 MFS transporter, SP family, sugar:H+ symporter [Fonsecaea erecta]
MADLEGNLRSQGVNFGLIAVLAVLGFGSLTYGYTAAIIGTTLGQPTFIKYFELDTRPNGTDLISTTNGLFQTGGVIGTLCLPWVLDKYGRKWACAVPAVLAIISGACMAGAVHIGMFIAFRFVAGASAFMVLAAVPVFMAEIVPVHLRGALVDIHGVMLVLGYVVQAWIGFGFYFWQSGSSVTWRPPVAVQCFFPLCLLVGLLFVPESPRWLVMQGRESEAEQIIYKLHRNKKDPDNLAAKAEFYQIQQQIAIERTLGSSWMHMFRRPSYRKRTMFGVSVGVIIQCGGVLVINNYGPSLYRLLGFSPVKQLLYPAAWLTFALGLNVISMFLIDHFPRNKYIAFGVSGCVCALICEAALVANFVPSDNHAALQAAVAMLFVYQLFYGLCLDGPQFAYIGELFPTHLRAKGVCLTVAGISAMNIIWLQSAPTAFEKIGWKFYLAFIIPASIGAIVMWFYFPNTKGVPLEEIGVLFGETDEVAVYQRDIEVDHINHTIHDRHHEQSKAMDASHVETNIVEDQV